MARKKLKMIHVPRKPEDEKFKSLDTVGAPTHSRMRKSKLVRDVVVLDREALRKMLDLKNDHHFT